MTQTSNFKLRLSNIFNTKVNYYLLLTIVFFAVCTIGLYHHEMWRDELESWLLARDSKSIGELLDNLKYTGHPALWYLCLYFIAKVTHNPIVIQLLQLVIATSVVCVVVYYGRFTMLQKALFCFGYFPLYEYGIISRSYGLGVLLIFSFCALFCRQNRNYIFLASILGLLAHTSAYGLIFAFIFASVLFIDDNSRQEFSSSQKNIKSKLVISAAIYLLCISTAVIQMIPPSNASYKGNISILAKQNNTEKKNITTASSPSKSLSPKAFETVATGIWRSYIPIPNVSNNKIWGSNFLANRSDFPKIASLDLAALLCALLSLMWFFIFVAIFWRSYLALWLYVLGNFIITIFGIVVKIPSIRHYGHLFILLIACCWIYNYQADLTKKYTRGFFRALLTAILFVQLCAGIMMYSIDLARPFSNSQKVAQFIQENNLENSIIIGSKDVFVSPLSAWLNKKIYYPETEDFGTYAVWTSKITKYNRNLQQIDILKQIEALKERSDESLLLVLDRELEAKTASINTKLLVSYEDAISNNENYFVYSVD